MAGVDVVLVVHVGYGDVREMAPGVLHRHVWILWMEAILRKRSRLEGCNEAGWSLLSCHLMLLNRCLVVILWRLHYVRAHICVDVRFHIFVCIRSIEIAHIWLH